MGLPLAAIGERVPWVREFCFNTASLLRETKNVGLALAMILPPLISARVAAFLLRRRGITDACKIAQHTQHAKSETRSRGTS
jgi:hypothetical protein